MGRQELHGTPMVDVRLSDTGKHHVLRNTDQLYHHFNHQYTIIVVYGTLKYHRNAFHFHAHFMNTVEALVLYIDTCLDYIVLLKFVKVQQPV